MMKKWYESTENVHDVVVSSRVRLARNLENYPFPAKCDHDTAARAAKEIIDALQKNYGEPLDVLSMNELHGDKRVFVEDHIVSQEFIAPSDKERVLLADFGGNLAVMIHEEDHVRIQALYPGFALEKAYETASRADDALSKGVSVAFDETLGFLTACPTNLGTGLRASVMLHLPAMCAFGYIKTLSALMTKIGLTVRGTFGEGSEATACLYQISNQVTLGLSEQDAIEKLRGATMQIVEKERELRKKMMNESGNDVTDKLWRSFGTLSYARKLSTTEASHLISNVRLAAACGVIPECRSLNTTSLLFDILPAHITSRFPEAVTPEKRDEYRAKLIRERLADASGADEGN